jgi:tartrate-resistant acid phosphatase type 5
MAIHQIAVVLVAAVVLAVALLLAAAELPRVEHPAAKDEEGTLSILVVGDWGRKGAYNQSRVAHQVISHHSAISISLSFSYSPGMLEQDDF